MSQINESAIRTPGVYINEIPLLPPSVAQVATAIPAFIGYTEKAIDSSGNTLAMKPKRISSMVEYETYFGKANTENFTVNIDGSGNTITVTNVTTPSLVYYMYYAMRMFFSNGGSTCYIVSVGGYADVVDNGDDDTGLLGGLNVLSKEDEPTIIVFPDAMQLSDADYYGLINAALSQCNKLGDRFTIVDIAKNGADDAENIQNMRDTVSSEKEMAMYGACYHPWLETNLSFSYSDTSATIGTHTNDGGAPIAGTIGALKANNSALYNLIKSEIDKKHVLMPPASAMAGIYSRVDASRGVWKAPANVNVINVVKPEIIYNDADQETMNIHAESGKSVNAIRSFVGKGTIVWGARTLAGNDNEWRYVSVRRFFNMVEESCKKASAQFVFEPNDANTWIKIRAMIENYLTILWRQGALAGAKPEHAFFVKIGLGQTMTAVDILEGRLIVEVGLAAVRPAEFIILRFMHKMQES